MNFYLVDFYPKPAYAKKDLRDIAVRVVANSIEQAKKVACTEILLENPEFNVHEFEVEVSEPVR